MVILEWISPIPSAKERGHRISRAAARPDRNARTGKAVRLAETTFDEGCQLRSLGSDGIRRISYGVC
jgi:hypothetical protein